jgi:hypothetical protein
MNIALLLLYQAPPFIEAGEKIVISTVDDSYMTRYVIESLIISLLYQEKQYSSSFRICTGFHVSFDI